MRLIGLTSVMIAVQVLLLTGTVLYARVASDPTVVHALDVTPCADRPCFMGIVPGMTQLGDAQLILKEHGASQGENETQYVLDNIIVGIYADGGPITAVYVRPRAGGILSMTVGEVFQHLGIPCAFNPDTLDQHELILIYPHSSVEV